ncbi:MAG: hypothetical protein HMLIMOIP_002095 [Candidatus Nitrosomirales archaeon]|jgi:hypothetical protein
MSENAGSRPVKQEAAIFYSKQREGKITKEALKRRLKALYSKKES